MNILFIGNGFDKAHSINIEFDEFVKSDDFTKTMNSYKGFFNDDKYQNLYKNTKLWSKLEEFCLEITKNANINKKIFYKNLSIAFINWFDKEWISKRKLKVNKNKFIAKLIQDNNYHSIFSFNYTSTAIKYGYKSIHSEYEDTWKKWTLKSIEKKLINLHYSINKENVFIIGNDKEEKINKNYLIENWGKKEIINHKKNYLDLLLKEKNIKQIDFYGFSFGESDINMIFFVFDFLKRGGHINIYDKFPEDIKKIMNMILRGKRGKRECFSRINFIKTA